MAFDIELRTGSSFGIVLSSAGATGQIKVWTGSSWEAKPMKVWNGSSWVVKPVKYWDGGAWVVTPY